MNIGTILVIIIVGSLFTSGGLGLFAALSSGLMKSFTDVANVFDGIICTMDAWLKDCEDHTWAPWPFSGGNKVCVITTGVFYVYMAPFILVFIKWAAFGIGGWGSKKWKKWRGKGKPPKFDMPLEELQDWYAEAAERIKIHGLEVGKVAKDFPGYEGLSPELRLKLFSTLYRRVATQQAAVREDQAGAEEDRNWATAVINSEDYNDAIRRVEPGTPEMIELEEWGSSTIPAA
jgi:hypothetical protein